MNKLKVLLVPPMAGAFYLLIWYSHAHELVKLGWYKIRKIPYYESTGKFHRVITRSDL
jgi:hypothetical protein